MTKFSPENFICLGEIVAAHGIRGAVKIFTHTEDPLDIDAYGDLVDQHGNVYKIRIERAVGDQAVIARINTIATRNDAERLIKTKLYIPKDALPESTDDDGIYYSQLEGMTVVDEAGTPLGVVVAIYNFGAGDVIEIKDADNKTKCFPYQDFAIHSINHDTKIIVINPEMLI